MMLFSLLLLLVLAIGDGKDLYSVLGIKKSASKQEIKKAYRQKAKDTHPDRNPGVDTETAANSFREIASAYEVLSDESSRRNYDRTGKTESERQEARRQQSHSGSQRRSSSNSRSQGWNFGNFNQQSQRAGVKYHRFFLDYQTRASILNAQSRVLAVTGLSHLEEIALDDETGLTERYLLLALYDSRVAGCEDAMTFYMMYPWPFGGMSNEGSQSMWWEETMVTTKIDLAAQSQGTKELQELLGVDFQGPNKAKCPSVAFFPRKSSLRTFEVYSAADEAFKGVEFREFVWQRLKMTVTIINRTPWKLNQWWLDGMRGKKLDDIEPGASYTTQTFLSHSFVYRASFVEGNGLNNQSAVFWYTSRIQEDGEEISIYPRCFDHHSDCALWAKQGFCDKNTISSRRNPDLHTWSARHCHVSCSLEGCSVSA